MSEDRLVYKGQDITLDVTMKIEHVVRIIARRRSMTFDDAYTSFVATRAHEALQKPASLMWAESAEYIADRYFEEIPDRHG
ncbi:MAG: hypothetical protein LBK42_00285 [Propionibacteriaceae bacterium]|jgi:hypothetical protein|nr:hypothetical protein [Propionibacteriaceae bacterium]